MRNQPAIDLKIHPLNPRQVNALQMTIDGYRKGEICERLGITQKTLFNWRRLPAWNEEVRAVLQVDSEDGQGQIKSLLPLAVQTLKRLIVNGTDNIKLGAARTVLEAHATLVAREEQAEVIRDLEVRLEQIAAGGLQALPAGNTAAEADVIDAELEPVEEVK